MATAEVPEQPDELVELRDGIRDDDREILRFFARRMEKVRAIGEYKKKRGMTPLQPDQHDAMLADRLEWAQELGIDPIEAARKLIEILHDTSVEAQQAIIDSPE